MKSLFYMYLTLIMGIFASPGCESTGVNDSIQKTYSNQAEKRISMADKHLVYYNSFEAEYDTNGWLGLNSEMFVRDPAPDGGAKSLLIGGGCPQPAGFRTITVAKQGYYNVNFWGKTGNLGGSIIVTAVSGFVPDSRAIDIKEKNWHYYEINNLFCLENSDINIEIMAGGFVPADINLDELKIERSIKSRQAELSAK